MGTAVLPARRRLPVSAWVAAPTAVALVTGLAYLALEPRPGDLAAHVFRAELFGREAYWFAAGGCVERAGDWTRVIARERGFMRLSTRFAPERIVEHGRRCDDG